MGLLRNNALIKHPYLSRYPTNAREWRRYIEALNAQQVDTIGSFSGGIEIVTSLPALPDTDYPQGSVVFLTTDEKLYRNTTGSTWSKAVDGGDITAGTVTTDAIFAGSITAAKLAATLTFTNSLVVSSGGMIRQGQTAFDTGAGFWLGDDSGTPKFSIGNSAGNKLTWDGATLTVVGALSGSFPASQLTGLDEEIGNGIESVDALPTLPDVSYPDGAIVYLTTDERLYRNDNGTWVTATINFTEVQGNLSSAQGGVEVISSLPTLPDADYPQGAIVFLTADNKLYRSTGSAWTKVVDTSDLNGTIDLGTQISGTLTEAFAAAGLINSNVTINADGTLTGAGAGQASLTSLPGTVAAGQIAANAVTTEKLNALAVTAAKIAASAIETDKLAANSVTAAKIATGTITTNEIAANTIVAGNIAAGTITAAELATDSVTAIKIQAAAVEAIKIASNAVTADKILAGAVTTSKLDAEAVTADKIATGVLHVGRGALNKDPAFETVDTTDPSGYWVGANLTTPVEQAYATVSRTDISTGVVGRSALLYSGTTEADVYSENIPINPNETYEISFWGLQSAGTGVHYAFVDFHDASGTTILGSTSGATGWTAIGTHFYFGGVANGSLTGSFAKYSHTFGPGGTATIPSNAASCHIGIFTNYGGSISTTTVYLQQFQLREVMGGTRIEDGAITADKITAGTITADKLNATLTFTSDMTVSTGGALHSGKTTVSDTTAGFWLGYDGSSNYDFHIGTSTTNYMWWDGSANTLTLSGNIGIENTTSTFSPTWFGFSTDPTTGCNYIKVGKVVYFWVDTTGNTGTSNSTSMSITNLPAEITPSSTVSATAIVINSSTTSLGYVAITSTNIMDFRLYTGGAFTASGTKGFPPGAMITYTLP